MNDPFDDPAKLHLLQITLEALVPIAIAELHKQGGPLNRHFQEAQAFGFKLAEHGDELLYHVKKRGVTGKLMGQFCKTVAVMAFVPGGVTVFGLHFEEKVAP